MKRPILIILLSMSLFSIDASAVKRQKTGPSEDSLPPSSSPSSSAVEHVETIRHRMATNPSSYLDLLPSDLFTELLPYLSPAGISCLASTGTKNTQRTLRARKAHELDFSGRIFSDLNFLNLFSRNRLFSNAENINLSEAQFNHSLLEQLPPGLKVLNLTGIITKKNYTIGLELLSYLRPFSKLHTLNLSNNLLGKNSNGPLIAEDLAQHRNLCSLNLAQNYLGNMYYCGRADQNGSEVAKHLAQLENLHTLNLADNDLGLTRRGWEPNPHTLGGGPAVTEHLSKLVHLKNLNLARNQLGNEGHGKGVQAVQHLTSLSLLQTLDISENGLRVDTTDADQIVGHLAQLPHLELVKMYDDGFKDQEVLPLTQKGIQVLFAAPLKADVATKSGL